MRFEKHTGLFCLLICLLLISLYYQYPGMLHMPPQGSHLWRQTDCMAMVWNYKLFDLPFFQPATLNLQSVDGKVAGEFPLFYFVAAQFQNPELSLRSVHTLLFIGGIIGVYYLAFYFLQNIFLSVCTALLLFTSPLLVFYGNNFLSDVSAWSFAMMGWAVFFNSYKKDKLIWQLLAFTFFSMAALLKASHAFNFAIAFFFQIVNRKSQIVNFIPYSLLLIPVAWYIYAKQYNTANHDTYYFLSIFPLWKMNFHDIGLSIWRMTVSWSNNYFWRPASVLLIVVLFYLVIKNKISNPELKTILILSFLFMIVYVLLFFERMKVHEYYYVVFFIFGVFAVIVCMAFVKTYSNKIWINIALLIFLLINIYSCKNFVQQKLQDQHYNAVLACGDFQKFMNDKGCTPDKTIISISDPSVNQSLYWMKRKGYTEYNDYVEALQLHRADYLLISSPDYLNKNELQDYLRDSVGEFQGVQLYKLK